jgi:alkanesulfonate monooxygenase SsuD/methylene tetrahydromethanopterin reductase-like flavin-dependent oxidoreductase (luciferase family)
VICADSDEEAEYLLSSVRLLQIKIRQGDRSPVVSPEDALRELRLYGDRAKAIADSQEGEWPRYFVGTAAKVKRQLNAMAETLGIGELVIVTITHSHAARLRSYDLLADAFGLPSAAPEKSEAVLARG